MFWQRNFAPLFLLFLCLSAFINAKELLILDHDGGVDDISALILLLGARDKFELKAVTIQPGDCFADTALRATAKYLDYLGTENVRIAVSNLEGTNPFPTFWREDSNKTEQKIDEFLGSSWDEKHSKNRIEAQSAPELLVELLSQNEDYIIVCTGPLSNLGAALQMQPQIAKRIKHLYIMGGAVTVPGNVEEYPLAGEWNFYNSPQAAAFVLRSSIANITLIALDATNHVPVRDPLVPSQPTPLQLMLEQNTKASKLEYELWMTIQDMIDCGIYYFWDTLTAVAAIEPNVVINQNMRIIVREEKPYEGRTEVVSEQIEGKNIAVAVNVDRMLFQKELLRNLR